MSVDFTKPVATADRAQNLADTKDTLVAVAKQLDDTTPTGVATGMLRWSSTNGKWQKYNGTSWADLAATYNINVSHLGGQAAANYLLSATAASTYLAKAGGTLTGFLTLHAAPTADMHAATKKYADDKVAALPVLASGTWTPTLTHVTNVSSSTARTCNYIRVGDMVHFSGTIDVTPGDVNPSTIRCTLPVASNFTSAYDATGTVTALTAVSAARFGQVTADTTNDAITIQLAAGNSGVSMRVNFTGSYRVL